MPSRARQRRAPSASGKEKDENDNNHFPVHNLLDDSARSRNINKPKKANNTEPRTLPSFACKRLTCWLLLFVVLCIASRQLQLFSEPMLNLFSSIRFQRKVFNDTDSEQDQTANSKETNSWQDNHNSEQYLPKIPKEVLEFETSMIGSFTPRPISVNGKYISPIPLHGSKEHKDVRVYIYENFLTSAECDGLRHVHDNHIRSTSVQDPIICFDHVNTLQRHLRDVGQGHLNVTDEDFTTGTTCINATFSTQLNLWLGGRWSYSTAFYPGESQFTHTFAQRVERASGLGQIHGGKFQITSYPEGVGYRSHTDCLVGSSEQRDRYATVLVYLKDVEEGGETIFTELGLGVTPKKGRALMWTNMNRAGKCIPASVHEAKPVIKGHKYILQRWYYFQNFYSLGKRVQEPPIPSRISGQPRVTCDRYEDGSCRWYDEWNYEHIRQYEMHKQQFL